IWAAMQASISEHSQLLKAAESSGWQQFAINKAEAAWSEVQKLNAEFHEVLSVAEKQLELDGYTFPEEAAVPTDEPPTWSKKDFTHETVPVTDDTDDALHSGLARLIDRLPSKWWRRQQQLIDEAGYSHLRESVELFGSISGKPAAPPIHRYAYALRLALAH